MLQAVLPLDSLTKEYARCQPTRATVIASSYVIIYFMIMLCCLTFTIHLSRTTNTVTILSLPCTHYILWNRILFCWSSHCIVTNYSKFSVLFSEATAAESVYWLRYMLSCLRLKSWYRHALFFYAPKYPDWLWDPPSMNLTTHLHLLARLGMSGAIPLLTTFALMV